MLDPILGSEPTNWTTCFVKLCGIIFTQSRLRLFDDVLSQFWNGLNDNPPSQLQWGQMAVTSVAALYQFNSKNSVLHNAMRRRKRATIDKPPSLEELHSGEAILPSSQDDQMSDHLRDFESRQHEHLRNPSDVFNADEANDISVSRIMFGKSCEVAFGLLSEVMRGLSDVNSIFVHIWLLFLLSSVGHQPVLKLLERTVPWQELAQILNKLKIESEESLNQSISLEQLATVEIAGPVLLEDVMISGLEWSERSFSKGSLENVDPMEEIFWTKDQGVRRRRIVSLGFQLTKVFVS